MLGFFKRNKGNCKWLVPVFHQNAVLSWPQLPRPSVWEISGVSRTLSDKMAVEPLSDFILCVWPLSVIFYWPLNWHLVGKYRQTFQKPSTLWEK